MNKKKVLKVIVIVIIVFVLVNAVGTGVWFMNYQGYFNKGNGKDYALDGVETIEDSPLKRMLQTILGWKNHHIYKRREGQKDTEKS